MRKKFIKWLIRKFLISKGMTHFNEEIEELRKQIKIEFPGYHLSRNPIGSGRKKKKEVQIEANKI